VCPWNKFAEAAREARFAAGPATDNPPLAELLTLDDRVFRDRFAGTPIKRTGRDRFLRNVLIAIGNSDDSALAMEARRRLADENPLVRGAAIWALSQLIGHDELAKLAASAPSNEPDASVRAEWRLATTNADPSS
jgi:epoxyqueuosine reductase